MDMHNSLNLLSILAQEPEMFFLDSSLRTKNQGRYSYLGCLPVDIIEAKNFDVLRQKPIKLPAVGSIHYDGTMRFGLYDVIIIIDHQLKTIKFKSFGNPQKAEQIEEFCRYHLSQFNAQKQEIHARDELILKSSMTATAYKRAVKQTLKHIHDGDIYQLNLTYALRGKLSFPVSQLEAIEVYRQLRANSPTYLSAFYKTDETYVLSSSPERFCALDKRVATLMPMKGTRPRASNKTKDDKYLRELLESAKEKAELLMVTDLARNDLGRVCEFGSVKVKHLRTIESYRQVFQATATVQGRLRVDKTIVDLLESAFPSGSVTGCPKMEAMSIIKKLEKGNRGLYTGAFGYFNFNNRADFNVLIRTLIFNKREVCFNVGSGIVADSNPHAEYEETLLKSQGMVEALMKGLKTKVIIL